ncbi:VOC family protein [Tessaracoccus sp. MC1756]|uniref:VOC family protein n=1 Tax=Tessaracoccus sp. MC1756 TaxID=2760311 RepID=UPI00160135FF|nr:VOC family protein [Tessaracoccus sp. MC1756]MBB1510680.1 4a-hydroxytetrahydrobiopterin dehydratase [Tessaracoccus sp. MC1756]
MTKLTRHDASEQLPQWRYLLGRMHLLVDAGSFDEALSFVNAVAALANEHDHHPEIDVRYNRVHLAVASHDVGAITDRDVRFGTAVTELVRERGFTSEPGRLAQLEIAIDALDIPTVAAFWQAVTGWDLDDDALTDPDFIGPPIWFQQMDEPRSQRNRIHLDLTVAHDEAPARLKAATDAGGTIINDTEAPSFWVLADPEGNEVCVCTWEGRDAWTTSDT